jgi:hypothetical protein
MEKGASLALEYAVKCEQAQFDSEENKKMQ